LDWGWGRHGDGVLRAASVVAKVQWVVVSENKKREFMNNGHPYRFGFPRGHDRGIWQ